VRLLDLVTTYKGVSPLNSRGCFFDANGNPLCLRTGRCGERVGTGVAREMRKGSSQGRNIQDSKGVSAPLGASTREHDVCQLRWGWEIQVTDPATSVILVPAQIVTNKEDHSVVMNDVTKSAINCRKSRHRTRAFTYRDRPSERM
jgi:hypothetical protein